MRTVFRTLSTIFLILLCASCLTAPAWADLAKDGKIVVVIDPGHGGIDGGTDAGTRRICILIII